MRAREIEGSSKAYGSELVSFSMSTSSVVTLVYNYAERLMHLEDARRASLRSHASERVKRITMLRQPLVFMCLTTILASASAVWAEAIPRIAKDTPYAQARKTLTGLGYKPEKNPDAEACDAKSGATCFPEKIDCAGSGLGQCIFLWRKGKVRVEVVTVGERPIVDRVRCRSGC